MHTGEQRFYFKINYSSVLEAMGDSEGAIRILQEVHQEVPGHLLLLRALRPWVNFCHLGRHEGGGALLPDIARWHWRPLARTTKCDSGGYPVRVAREESNRRGNRSLLLAASRLPGTKE